jgi:hypothetical protein
MTEIIGEDGKTIVTDLPAEAVADLTPAPAEAKVEEPTTPAVEPNPAAAVTPEPAKAPEVPAEVPTTPVDRQPKKATPFQTLLEKKHEAEERAQAAEAKAQALEAQIQQLSTQAPGAATDDDIATLATELNADPAILQRIVDVARKGMKPELPKEVTDLIAKQQEQQQAQAESAAFTADVSRLQVTLKDDLLKDPAVQQKLQELAYSTEKAPDGEPYFKKPLFELYMTFVKPEVEPGKATLETAIGGSKAGGDVMDFREINGDETKLDEFAKTSTSEQWNAYVTWRDANSSDVPIRRN